MTGDEPINVDHKDLDPSNNRWSNLRAADWQTNPRNRRAQSNNRAGLKGVTPAKAPGRWRSTIVLGKGRQKYLGTFTTPEEAHAAYCAAAQAHFGEFWRAN